MLLLSDSFEPNLPPSVTACTQLWVMAKWITVQLLSCLCLPAVCVCVYLTSACVWARETSAIVGLLHPDNWEPDGLKITQRFPILSSFGTASPRLFWFLRASPRNARGHRRPLPVTWLLIVVARNCPWTYSNILHRGRKGLCCHISELRARWPSLNTVSEWQSFFFVCFILELSFPLWASQDKSVHEGLCTHAEQN